MGSFDIFVKASGLTSQEFSKQMEQGNILAKDILPKVAEEYRRVARENGALAKAMEKVAAQEERFRTALTTAKDTIFRDGFGDGMARFFRQSADMLSTMKPFFTFMGGFMGGMMDVFKGITTVIGGAFQGLAKLLGLMDNQTIENVGRLFGTAGGLALGALVVWKIGKAARYAATAFAMMNLSMKAVAATALRIVAPFLILEDIIVGLQGGKSVSGGVFNTMQEYKARGDFTGNLANAFPVAAMAAQGVTKIIVEVKDSEWSKSIKATVADTIDSISTSLLAE